MKTLVIYASDGCGGTLGVARAMAETLNARLVETNKVKLDELNNYDLVGFGSGVFHGNLRADIFETVAELPKPFSKKAFIFSDGGCGTTASNDALENELVKRGVAVVGSFACKGAVFSEEAGLFGTGLRQRPSASDFKAARVFAQALQL